MADIGTQMNTANAACTSEGKDMDKQVGRSYLDPWTRKFLNKFKHYSPHGSGYVDPRMRHQAEVNDK